MPKANILVLDDDPVVRRALTDTLTDEGYQVETAADGLEGLEKAKAPPFDILLVDLRLPGMDGIEVLREIREVTPEVIVILMTAYATLETAKEAMKLGAYDYIAKPLDPDAVTALLEKALEKRRLNLEMKAAVEVPKILVVDDEAIVCQALTDVLGDEGYRVTTVQSAYEALDMMKRETFHILIADLRLPDLDGIELIAAARGIDPEILALVITGYPSIETAVEAMKTSAYDYITKPIDSDLLVAAVRRGWERQRLAILNKQLLTRLLRTNEELREAKEKVEQLFEQAQQEIAERRRAEEELRRSFEKLRRTLEETVHTLTSAVEMRDPYTAGHQRRVTQLACAIANEMDLPEEQIEGLRMAGLIHDLGKINVPAEILSKPGGLNSLQYDLIKMHSQVGHDVLKTVEFPWPLAQIVLQHHERMDGSGYPQGLSGEEIILEARILAVADVVEAMASRRPYRPPRGIKKALEEISQNRGVLYDPEVVDACLKLFIEKGFTFE